MRSNLGGERGAVQNPMLKYAQEAGWEYVKPVEATGLRGGETGLVFRDIFIEQMKKLNPGIVDDEAAGELIKRIERIPPTVEGSLHAWEYLKGLKTVFVQAEKRERNVCFISKNADENVYHVTDEFRFNNGTKTNKADIVLLINGVPVFLVETKASHKVNGIEEAMKQIRRYHYETPEMLAVLQLYALTHIVQFYYAATWSLSRKGLFNWKDEASGDFESLVKTFLDKDRVIKVLTDYILFTRQDDELKKVVLRPHQMRAVGRVVERAGDTKKQRGLVWHTQGSGKTYTMIVAAQKLIENKLFENPTVIMLVDRNELETQLFGNLASVGFENVEVANSKHNLRKLLEQDRRGLIVTMIHKFDGMPEKVNQRNNIFVLVDEAHRTTGGKLGNYLMGALPNATYIGFTGTPIDKTSYGKGTFITFGKEDPPAGYLDKYGIAESIEDGTTVPLHYTLAPNDLRVDRETLEKEFFDLAETEGISDVDELNKVLERAVTLRNILKNPDRVERIAEYVAKHFTENIEPMGYKAFLVAVDREACTLYKKELDKHLPPEYSEVVYSPAHNDPPELAKYHLSDTKEKRIRRSFRNPSEKPKILIVTEKLLTGFDAPVLYCMYLDKPMRDHVLLQAIARVNRPYEDEDGRRKPSGFVLDFVGIFDNLEKALAFDSADVAGIVQDIGVLQKHFTGMMSRAKESYLSIIKNKKQDKAVEAVLEHFRDEETRHEFYRFFRELSDIYEILSPDAFLRPYVEDYETLARMYRIVREAYEPGVSIDDEFARKTAKLVQEHTESGPVKKSLDVYKIDEKTLKKIQDSDSSDTEKVFNLLKSILDTVRERAEREPYLISIGERAELIASLYKQRQSTTQKTLESLKDIVEEINAARKEQAEKDMPTAVFAIFWILKKATAPDPESVARDMKDVLETYPHWAKSEKHEKKVRQALYRNLAKAGLKDVERLAELSQRVMTALKGEKE